MLSPARRSWPWLGALAGALVAAFDFALFRWLHPGRGPLDLWILFAVFLANMATLGFALGHLHLARCRARADAETIRAQLAELERSGRAVLQAEKLAALGRVAAGIAHEVRNPLGVIRSSASLIEEDLAPGQDEPRRACRFIIEEIDRLDRLVGGLLAFARPCPVQARPFALRAAVERALRLCEPALAPAGVAVEGAVDPALPEVGGDPDLIQQVIFGLVVNAAEAGARRVTVRAGQDGGQVFLDVEDDGPGVPAEHAEALFEPFFTTKEGGTGLGLPTAARIAEAHGGTLSLLPRPPRGSGACFRLRLPVAGEGARS
jgi:signal transduction histidine kinase